MMNRENVALVFIDVQGKLAQAMHDLETLSGNLVRLLKGAQLMDIPVLWTEQIPEKMGPTMEPFDGLLRARAAPLAKTTFSCWGEPAFREAVTAGGRYQFVLCGIETHVCVYQTAMDLLLAGFEVAVAADAVASRTATNKAFALECMRDAGAAILTTEMILFEWVRDSKEPVFRDVLKLVK